MGMDGNLPNVAKNPAIAMNESKYMKGIGITPEALENSPVAYELLFDMTWTKDPIDEDAWIAKYPSVVSMIGKLNIRTELNLMSHLDVMLSMDSANMHLASLVNIPVVSIWGATHPYAGFMGWKQLPVNTVQLDLSCRPCSVYGQKPCWRGDYACLRDIKPEQVIAKIEGLVD